MHRTGSWKQVLLATRRFRRRSLELSLELAPGHSGGLSQVQHFQRGKVVDLPPQQRKLALADAAIGRTQDVHQAPQWSVVNCFVSRSATGVSMYSRMRSEIAGTSVVYG